MIIKVNDVAIDVTFGCYYPESRDDNNCPTRSGNCVDCPFCKAVVDNPKALFMIQKGR